MQNNTGNQESRTQLPSQLVNWVYSVLQPQYTNKQICYTHIIQYLQIFFARGFKIRTRVYTSERGGNSNLLINIFGKIDDNIPIEIWIPLDYPFVNPHNGNEISNGVPIVFVVPDNNNGIYLKPGNFIDTQGRFYHPFLTEWFNNCKASDINSIKVYNLLSLVNVLTNAFRREVPIYKSNSSAPTLPPKPRSQTQAPSVTSNQNTGLPISNQSTGPSISVQSTGPPLPSKPVPLKYQHPLPLPRQESLSLENSPVVPHISHPQPHFTYPKSPSPPEYFTGNSRIHSPVEQRNMNTYNDTRISVNFRSNGLEDLMDRDNRSNRQVVLNRETLVRLSNEINNCLQDMPINRSLDKLNVDSMKINQLYDQLNYHNTQAKANKTNLESHLNYLTNQLSSINNLNSNLQAFTDLNNGTDDHIFIGAGQKLSIDDLIIPDSVLTKQLYDTVCEIKANKDCINLINGSFSGESEVISNENFDSIIKYTRNISRETFWLELTKLEIAKKMSITD